MHHNSELTPQKLAHRAGDGRFCARCRQTPPELCRIHCEIVKATRDSATKNLINLPLTNGRRLHGSMLGILGKIWALRLTELLA